MIDDNKIKLLLQHYLRIRHLVLLTAIAEHGSLLKAAAALNLTQSATTRALLELENSLRLPLFNRSSRGVTPTIFGQALIKHAEAMLVAVRNAAEELTELKAGSAGRVIVGTLRAAAPSLLPRALTAFRKDHPNVTVTIAEGTFQVLGPALRSGEIDLIVGYLSEFRPRQGITQQHLYDDTAALMVRRGHPSLKQKKRLALGDLMDQPWILPLRDTVLRRYIDAGFRADGFDMPKSCIESITTTLIQSLLTESDCVVALPRQVAVQFSKLGMGVILPVKFEGAGLPVGLTMRADRALTPAARALADIMQRIAETDR